MKYLIEATKLFERVVDKEVDRVRTAGEQWVVTKERLDQLQKYDSKMIKVIEVIQEKKMIEKEAVIKETRKGHNAKTRDIQE